jgi:hypothetical protein
MSLRPGHAGALRNPLSDRGRLTLLRMEIQTTFCMWPFGSWNGFICCVSLAPLHWCPMSRRKQAQDERDIFDLFVECAKLNIPASSIRSGKDREPDILCTLDGNPCAFELGELSDEEFRKGLQLDLDTERMLNGKLLLSLPPPVLADLQARYPHHFVNIAFFDGASLRARERAATDVLKLLAARAPPNGLQTTADLPASARKAIKNFEVVPTAPHFWLHPVHAAYVTVPDLRVLDKKPRATYNTSFPVDLLLHGEYNLTPRDSWLARYEQPIRDKIDGSQFRRAWVFDPAERAQDDYALWLVHENASWP